LKLPKIFIEYEYNSRMLIMYDSILQFKTTTALGNTSYYFDKETNRWFYLITLNYYLHDKPFEAFKVILHELLHCLRSKRIDDFIDGINHRQLLKTLGYKDLKV
jgi:hypothetical protein